MLHNSGCERTHMKRVKQSQTFERDQIFIFQFFKKRWSYASNFFKLRRQVSRAAIVKFPGNLGKSKIIIQKQLFYTFYLMENNKMFDRDIFNFRKNFRQVGIIRF